MAAVAKEVVIEDYRITSRFQQLRKPTRIIERRSGYGVGGRKKESGPASIGYNHLLRIPGN